MVELVRINLKAFPKIGRRFLTINTLMKSSLLFLLAVLVGSVNVSAQNLVPNGSFEEGIECPSFIGNVDAQCADWFNSISYPSPSANQITPEWYHACGELDVFVPPNVAFGYQDPPEREEDYSDEEYLGVRYGEFIPMLIAAHQERNQLNEDQQARIDALQSQIDQLNLMLDEM